MTEAINKPDLYIRSKEPRHVCPHCGRNYAINPRGVIRRHRDFGREFNRSTKRLCPGVGEQPERMWVWTGKDWMLVKAEQ